MKRQGANRTGLMTSPALGEEMAAATREFPPSAPGTTQAIADARVAYARQTETRDAMPLLTSTADDEMRPADTDAGNHLMRLMDKLGERLAFEHAGARLYEALLSKHEAYGDFPGGPSAEDLMHVLREEYEHADMLERALKELGGDPTVVTPSANLAANLSAGLPQVLSDPRTNLLQCLEAIVVAELTDNECWTALNELARQAGHEELVEACQAAVAHERDHLRKVRDWIAAGQGRAAGTADMSDRANPTEDDADAVSDEEVEGGESAERSKSGKRGRRRSTGSEQ